MSIKLQRWFWICLILLSPAIPLEAYFAGNWYSILHSYSLAMFFGIISYIWLGNSLIMSGRLPFLDRVLGQDRVMVLHGYLATAALFCGLTHAIFKSVYFDAETVQVKFGSLALILFISVAIVTVFFMVNSLILRIPLINVFRNFCVTRLGFDYSRLKLFHNLTAFAMALLLIHVMMASPTSETTYRLVLTGAWGAVSIAVYIYHKGVRFFWCKSKALNVTSVELLSENILSISSEAGDCRHEHLAGQFGYFRILSPECGIEEHPFTIASEPASESLEIVIKILGDYTAKLKRVSPGSKLLFDGPYGIFTPELNAHSYIFIAGGIGITPFLSIIREWSNCRITKPVTLIWTVNQEADLIDQGLFESLAKRQRQFNYVKVLTRNTAGESKHLNQELIAGILPKEGIEDLRAYLCGPETLRRDVTSWLKRIGFPRRHIHYENFGN